MQSKWHVLYLRPRWEKKMGEYCVAHGFSYYLPLREETKIYQRRRVTVHKPLFPGYVFVTFEPDERLQILKTNNVVRILEPRDQRTFLHQLAQIRRALRVDPTLGACAMLEKGRRVRILAGPFQGVEGFVETLKGQTRVLLNIEMIGQAIAVETDREFLEVVD